MISNTFKGKLQTILRRSASASMAASASATASMSMPAPTCCTNNCNTNSQRSVTTIAKTCCSGSTCSCITQPTKTTTTTTKIQTHNLSTKPFHLPQFNSIEEEMAEASQRYAHKISIELTSDRGYGLVALQTYQPGDKVLTAKAVASVPRDSHSVQKGMDAHVRIDLPARFINHSCDANCGVQDNEFGAYDFIARRTIQEGEELSFNYETSEYVISAFEECMCGAKNCRGYVAGFGTHGEQLKDDYGEYIAGYLKESI
jgi:hypothetical protein